MVTRVYFPAAQSGSQSITYDTNWNITSSMFQTLVYPGVKTNTSLTNKSVAADSTATIRYNGIYSAYFPIHAQTISGNIKGQFMAYESNAAYNGTLCVSIRVMY